MYENSMFLYLVNKKLLYLRLIKIQHHENTYYYCFFDNPIL